MKGKYELDGLGKAGVILNVIFGSGLAFFSIVYFFVGIVRLINLGDGISIVIILLSISGISISTIGLVYNARVLSGELEYKYIACIIGFVSLSILGSVLLIVSQNIEIGYESGNSSTNNNDLADTLIKFKELLDNDAITVEEYSMIKRKILSS